MVIIWFDFLFTVNSVPSDAFSMLSQTHISYSDDTAFPNFWTNRINTLHTDSTLVGWISPMGSRLDTAVSPKF